MTAPPVPAETQPPKRHRRSAHQWYIEVLEFCRSVAGLPAVVGVVLDLLGVETKIVRFGTGTALLVAIALRFFHKIRPLTMLPLLVSSILAVVLILFVAPQRVQKENAILASSWLDWEKSLDKAVANCDEKDLSCLAKGLIPLVASRPTPHDDSDATRQVGDLLAGSSLLANYKSRAFLRTRLSIDKQFVGSGRTEKLVSEYLVANLRVSDTSPHLWFWELDFGKVQGQKLLDVLQTPTYGHHPSTFKDNWSWVSQHLRPDDARPALVRFEYMDSQKYSGCLGRKDATRVFMSSLGELGPKTVDEGYVNSGHTEPDTNENSTFKLLIWVYQPVEQGQAVAATWQNVLTQFNDLATSNACTSPQ